MTKSKACKLDLVKGQASVITQTNITYRRSTVRYVQEISFVLLMGARPQVFFPGVCKLDVW